MNDSNKPITDSEFPNFAPPPSGPDYIPLPPTTGGVFVPAWDVAAEGFSPATREYDQSWMDNVDESLVLCNRCRYAWRTKKYAAVRNTKPDGTPIMAKESYCMFPAKFPGGAPLTLEERCVTECNRFEEDNVND